MKNQLKIVQVLVLTLIYCFAINASKETNKLDFSKHSNCEQQDYYHASVSTNLLYETPVENTTANIINLPLQNFKKSFLGFWPMVENSNQLVNCKYIQYQKFSSNLLIYFYTTRISFPFHYFW